MATLGDSFDTDYEVASEERRQREGETALSALEALRADIAADRQAQGRDPETGEKVPEPETRLFETSDVLLNGLVGGLRDAAVQTAETAAQVSPAAPFFRGVGRVARALGFEKVSPDALVPEVQEPETVSGKVARPLAQFATVFLPAAAALRLAGVGAKVLASRPKTLAFAQGSVAGAAADVAAFDPHEERLANLAQDFGVENALVDALAAGPDDTEWEGRLKNLTEGLIVGGVAEVAVRSLLRGLRGTRQYLRERTLARASGEISEESLALIEQSGKEVMFAREHVADVRRAFQALTTGENLDPELVARLGQVARADARGFGRDVLAPMLGQAEENLARAELGFEDALRTSEAPFERVDRLRRPVDEYVPEGMEDHVSSAKVGQDEAVARPEQPRPAPAPPSPPKDSVLLNRLKVTPDQARGLRAAIRAGDVAEQTDWLAASFDSTNFDRIVEEDGVKDILASLAREFGRSKNTLRDATERPLQATAEAAERMVRADARELGASESQIVEMLDDLIPGTQDLDVKINAVRTLELSLAKKVHQLAEDVTRSAASPRDEAEFVRYATLLANVNDARAGVVTQLGRALSSLRIQATSDEGLERALDQIISRAGGRFAIRDLAVKLSGARGSRSATRRVLQDVVTRSGLFKRMFLEHYINSLLASPVTTVVNALSNTAVGFWMPAERALSGALLGDRQMMAGAARMYIGLFQGLKASFLGSAAGRGVARQSAGLFVRGRFGEARSLLAASEEAPSMLRSLAIGDTITVPNSRQFDLFEAQDAITSDNVRQLNRQRLAEGKSLGFLLRQFQRNDGFSKVFDAMGTAIRLPSRLLTSFDELAKAANYHAKLHQIGFDDAVKQGLEGADIDRHIASIVDGAPRPNSIAGLSAEAKQQLNHFDKQAKQFAARNTFTEELPFGSFSRSVQDILMKHPMLRVLIPFLRTPVNLLKFSLRDRTPLGLLFKETQQELAGSSAARARMAIGTSFAGMAAMWAGEGRITGGGPTDPGQRRALEQSGWKPYSIRIPLPGGQQVYISYNRFDPLGMILGLGADLAELNGRMENGQVEELAAGLVATLSRNITSKSYFQSLEDMAMLIHDPGRFFTQFGTRTLGAALVPASNLFLQLKRVSDPTLTQVDRRDLRLSFGSALQQRLPDFIDDAVLELMNRLSAAREALEIEPVLNIWGEEVTLPLGFGPDIMSPFFASTASQEPVRTEIARLGMPLNMRQMFSSFPAEGGGMPLSPREINQYIRLTANPPGQRSLEARLNALISSKRYRVELSDTHVDPRGEPIQGGRPQAIQDVINTYRANAKRIMLSKSKGLRERYASRKLQERLAKSQRGLEALSEAGNPDTASPGGAAALLDSLRGNP